MAHSDLLISLVKASVSGDKKAIRTAVESIIADEKNKQHRILADRLERALNTSGTSTRSLNLAAHDPGIKGREFLAELTPKHQLNDMVLADHTRETVNQLIEEQQRASLLRSHGLNPRHRIMLVGPPGNGKTSLAEAIAEALAVPFFVIRYEALIGSYLGETANRMKRVFDYVRTTPCVVFFDEFDAVGKERGDTHETGEIKRVVSSLLMHVDELPSYAVIIAASNHAELLDRAVWRRFQLRLTLPAPTEKELIAYFERSFQQFDRKLGISPATLAKRLGEISYAEAEEFILDVRRREVLSLREKSLKAIFADQIKAWGDRAKPVRQEECVR
ncbi:AAA family ATPase [Maritalea sp. S77]|uniref:AAA family ATPase n=1 Tax=Maritalea sp. S77 TaxID=3415125 RepID=UPI003C7C1C57